MKHALDNYFEISKLGSSIRIELLAGLSTFLSLSYIFIVNPAILAEAGMDKSFALFATIIASALATLIMGIWARLPFVLSPGLEMNAYVAFVVVQGLGLSWQQGLGMVFWSGVLFMVLTIFKIREHIIRAIPAPMKSTLSLSVGVFLMLIAASLSGILRFEGINVRGLGDFTSPKAIALYISLALVLVLDRLRVRAAVLLSIIATAAYCNWAGIIDTTKPAELSSAMFSGIGALDIRVILEPVALSGILILFLVDFYGSIAKFIGLTLRTSITKNNDGEVPRTREALSIDGSATILGSLLGTSSITTFVESGVGIAAGGRTGLTAVTCGVLMLLCFGIVPFLAFIPVVATTGALVYVGWKLVPDRATFIEYDWAEKLAAMIMPVLVVLTFSLEKAMLAGFLIYILRDIFTQGQKPNPYLAASTLALAIGIGLQLLT
jgi:AGZA family xanthine/uracil permease-like MFS transporter